MQKLISMAPEEKRRFMCSLYSIFDRDKKISKTEGEVLRILGQVFAVHQNQFGHCANPDPELIAAEINLISDVRARIYFMSIINEVYGKEVDTWMKNPFGADSFPKFYSTLKDKIKLTST